MSVPVDTVPLRPASPGREREPVAQTAARVTEAAIAPVALGAGRVLVHQGGPCTDVLVVVAGALLESAVDDAGRVLGIDVLGPGDPVGGPPGSVAAADVRTLVPSRVRPGSHTEVVDLLEARRQHALELARRLAWLDVPARIAMRLDDLAARFGRPVAGGTAVRLALTQEDLAALCGTSRESANRAIRSLVRQGRIETSGRGRFLVRPALHSVGLSP